MDATGQRRSAAGPERMPADAAVATRRPPTSRRPSVDPARRTAAGRSARAARPRLGSPRPRCVVALVRMFLVQTFVIPSRFDGAAACRWATASSCRGSTTGFGEVQRGDVVVFDGRGVFARDPAGPSPARCRGARRRGGAGRAGRRDRLRQARHRPARRPGRLLRRRGPDHRERRRRSTSRTLRRRPAERHPVRHRGARRAALGDGRPPQRVRGLARSPGRPRRRDGARRTRSSVASSRSGGRSTGPPACGQQGRRRIARGARAAPPSAGAGTP